MKKITNIILLLITITLSGCLSPIYTAASMVYDRHNIYKKLNDYNLSALINQEIYEDKLFKNKKNNIELAVFNLDVLITGHVESKQLRNELLNRVNNIKGSRRIFNQITTGRPISSYLKDSWITTKIRSQMVLDANINPKAFKVITSQRIVYLMGDVKKNQAKKVIKIARNTSGVLRVVKLMKYYKYTQDTLKQAL